MKKYLKSSIVSDKYLEVLSQIDEKTKKEIDQYIEKVDFEEHFLDSSKVFDYIITVWNKKEYVKVDGKIVSKTGLKLKENQIVDVHFPESEFSSVKNLEFIEDSLKDKEIQIIYEDEYILVLNKPFNLNNYLLSPSRNAL